MNVIYKSCDWVNFVPGKFGGRPLSRHSNRPSSSRSLDDEMTQRTHQIAQASQQRPPSNKKQHQDRGIILRQSSEELVSPPGVSFVPRPPSRQKDSRPKSAKGRVRPSSRSGRENVVSREGSTHTGDQAPFPPPLKLQSSFSKYKPLPSIGTGLVPAAENYRLSSNSLVKGSCYNNDANEVNSLLQKTAGLSLQHTLPDEPADIEPGRVHLAIKLLDGSRHERWFRHTDTLGVVMAFAASLCNDQLPPCHFCTNEVPRRVFDDFSLSLSEAGINSRTVVYLEDIV